MKLIIAQGNPEAKYTGTRHNVGFWLLDYYASEHSLLFTSRPKFHADIAEFDTPEGKVLLVKPTTYYNETGHAARALVDFYKLEPANDVLVIHDDIALQFGTIRTREKGSDGGNNGVKSLNTHIGENYRRLRIGIRTDIADRIDAADFVLGSLSKSEKMLLTEQVQPTATQIIDGFIAGRFHSTSHT